MCFSDLEATTPSSIKGKRETKDSHTNKLIRLYNWNQPIRHIECYTLTVLQYKTRSNTTKVSTIIRYSHFAKQQK